MAIQKFEPPPGIEPANEKDRRDNWREQGFLFGLLMFPELLIAVDARSSWDWAGALLAMGGYGVLLGVYGLISSGIISAFEYSRGATRWTHIAMLSMFIVVVYAILAAR